MSEAAEKPFEATPRRLARARREGNVARSSELAANCAFAAAALALLGSLPLFAAVTAGALHASLAFVPSSGCVLEIAVALLPICAAALAGIAANLAASGGLALTAISPRFERLNPLEGLRRIFSRETLAHSLRASLAFACAAAAMLPIVTAAAPGLAGARSLNESAAHAWSAACGVAFAAGGIGTIFSIAEFAAARTAWLRRLRMSFEERRRETKEEEGDAQARGRRRSLHRALLRGGLGRVKEAAFVVANPTHVAVALAYAPPRVAVPSVLVRATGEAALRVRAIAARLRIPVVENAPLARALFAQSRAGEPISHAQYAAVAEVVAALMRAGLFSQ